MKVRKGLRGFYSRCRTFIIGFGYTDGSWAKYLGGYTHAFLIEELPNGFLMIDFSVFDCPISYVESLPPELLESFDCIRIVVRPNRKQRLFKMIPLQTCATLIQTICGFNVGAILAQTLINRLQYEDNEWLLQRGVVDWEWISK